MKRLSTRLLSLVLVLSMLFAYGPMVFAATPDDGVEPQASAYISTTYAYISGGGGSVTVSFNIGATRQMANVGAYMIEIKNTSGTVIKTFYSSSTSGMMGSNCIFHNGSVSYSGVLEGASYYAIVYFKAGSSTAYDTAYYITDYAKA